MAKRVCESCGGTCRRGRTTCADCDRLNARSTRRKIASNALKVSAKPDTRDPWTRAADVHAAADHDKLFPRAR
jgi:hypothetical protein